MKLKPVNVDLDREGNAIVTEIPQDTINKPEDEQNNDNEGQDGSGDEPDDTNDTEPAGDGQDNGSEDTGDKPEGAEPDRDDEEGLGDLEGDEDEDEGTSGDEPSRQVNSDDDDVVDYDELPEAVQKYLDFFEETGGRGLEDFIKAQTNWAEKPEDQVIREYYQRLNPSLDPEDIDFDLKDSFGFDEDLDDDSTIRRKKIARKKFYGEAIKQLTAENAKYKTNLESSAVLPESAKEALAYREQTEAQRAAQEKSNAAKREYFVQETNKVLGKDFKGFEINLGDGNTATYKPENVQKTKEQNLNVNNLLNKFTDKNGNITDVAGYHKALSVASDPEGFAKHFYEMGRAAMAENDAKTTKNINMGTRQVQQPRKTGGFKVKAVEVRDDGRTSSTKPMIKLRNY